MANLQLQQAITAIKSGKKQSGQQILHRLLAVEPNNEPAWLWLAAATDDCIEKIRCLNRVLELNPDNQIAREGLSRLAAVGSQPAKPNSAPVPLTSLKKHDENATSRQCPYCAETIKAEALVCRYCGRDLGKETAVPIEAVALTWDEVWFSAVSQPSMTTFDRILADPQAAPNRAYRWLILSSLVAAALGFLLKLIIEMATTGKPDPTTLILLLVGVAVLPFVSLAGMAFNTALTQSVARWFKGQGSYAQLIYARAAYLAPLSIVMTAVAAIPYVDLLTIPLSIFALILDLMALRAVNRFGWGAALGATIIPGVIIGLAFGCLIILFSSLLAALIISGRH